LKIIKNIGNFFKGERQPLEPMELREGVKQAYSSVATKPKEKHPFPVGRHFAENIGYSKEILDNLPKIALRSFTGVTNVSVFAEIPKGSIVLDVGCGAGLDTLIASRKTGKTGRVIGIDFSIEMLECACSASKEFADNINYYCADAENLPVHSESIDIIIVNGIFNLNPFRTKIFGELYRVIKREGNLYISELIEKKEQNKSDKIFNLNDWFT
jgi:arsenite methyltransferase